MFQQRRDLLKFLMGSAVTYPNLLRAGAGLTAATLLPGCAENTDSGPQLPAPRVALAWIKNVEYAGLFVAETKQYYTLEGIAPIFLNGGPNAPMPSVSVAANNAQFGFDNDLRRFMDAVLLGNDLVMLGAQYQRSPGGVISLSDRPIRKAEDLIGCRFLGQEGVETIVDAVLKVAGLPLDYEFLPAGYSVASLVEGQGDAYSGFAVNQPLTLEQKYGMRLNKDYFFTSWSELGLKGYANMLFCARSYLQDNFDIAVKFLKGTIQGWQFNASNIEYGAQLVVDTHGRNLGLELDQQLRQNEIQQPFMQSPLTQEKGIFWIDAGTLETEMYPSLKAAGRDNLPDPERLIDTSVLSAAYAELSTMAGQAEI